MSISDHEEDFVDLFGGSDDENVKQPEHTFQHFERQPEHVLEGTTSDLKLRLVGSHPLWAHYLWNAAKVFATYLDENKDLCRGKSFLELGAGAALPSLIAAINGAKKTVITDYPDRELIENIEYNVKTNLPSLQKAVSVKGYVWGTKVSSLQEELSNEETKYDVIILSDLIFNHSQHHAMLRTCRELIKPKTGVVLVFYTHHRPHLAHRDVQFFEIAQRPFNPNGDPENWDEVGYSFHAEEFLTKNMGVMFEEDQGDQVVRSTVHGWKLWLD
ncbi:putative methyltransferase-domain-containing protein [Umbelopsis sp. PMI_123]|nr:putative methyltransferase-domain-containing protein [Umbelopsis sp. PMI_123]